MTKDATDVPEPWTRGRKPKKDKTVNEIEEQEEENARMYAAIAFAFILIVIGVPLWWHTTEVYRVALPYNDIAGLQPQEEKGMMVRVYVSCLDAPRGELLCEELHTLFKISKLFVLNCSSTPLDMEGKRILGSVQSLAELDKEHFLTLNPGEIHLLEVPGLARFSANQVVLGNQRTVYFASDTNSIKLEAVLDQWLLREASQLQLLQAMRSPSETGRDKESRVRVPPTIGPLDVLLSLVLPSPEQLEVKWDVPQATEEYLLPFLDHLSNLAQFSVKSQVLYFATLGVRPKAVNSKDLGAHFALSEEVLPQVISPLEKKLGSHVSTSSGLSLVMYVPSCSEAPLHLYSKRGHPVPANALLSARWGGLVVINPESGSCQEGNATLVVPSLKVMGVFLAHLRQLLGISDLDTITKAEILPLSEARPRLWEIDSLMRTRALEQLTSATLTLQSLSQLLGQIGNIVIGDEVGQCVVNAVVAAQKSSQLLAEGRLQEGHDISRIAFLESESAFTDPSLLALLYFPDDQKYAVYIPLFLPVMIPVLMSLKTIKSWVVRKMSSSKSKQD